MIPFILLLSIVKKLIQAIIFYAFHSLMRVQTELIYSFSHIPDTDVMVEYTQADIFLVGERMGTGERIIVLVNNILGGLHDSIK